MGVLNMPFIIVVSMLDLFYFMKTRNSILVSRGVDGFIVMMMMAPTPGGTPLRKRLKPR